MIGIHPQVRIELSRSFRVPEAGPAAEHRPPAGRPRSRGLRPGSVARRVVPRLRPQQLRP
jgi:hypothetical protein